MAALCSFFFFFPSSLGASNMHSHAPVVLLGHWICPSTLSWPSAVAFSFWPQIPHNIKGISQKSRCKENTLLSFYKGAFKALFKAWHIQALESWFDFLDCEYHTVLSFLSHPASGYMSVSIKRAEWCIIWLSFEARTNNGVLLPYSKMNQNGKKGQHFHFKQVKKKKECSKCSIHS